MSQRDRNKASRGGRTFRLRKRSVRPWESGILAALFLLIGIVTLPSGGCGSFLHGEGIISTVALVLGILILVARWIHLRRLL